MKTIKLFSRKEILLIVIIFVSRFGFFPANFSPLGSFGFLSKNFVLFFGSIILFDILNSGLYNGVLWTYLAFLAYPILGALAKTKKQKILLIPVASMLFFLLSNFGSFLTMYPQNISGLIDCYINALPFLQNTLVSDLFFTYSFIVIAEYIKNIGLLKEA